MTFKSIVCIFSGKPHEFKALDIALGLASAFRAELRCLQISLPISAYPELCAAMVYGQPMDGCGPIIENLSGDHRAQPETVRQYIAERASLYGVPFETVSPAKIHNAAFARFQPVTALVRDCVSVEGRSSDLIVAGRMAAPAKSHFDELLAALFTTARPVLLVPEESELNTGMPWIPKTVAIAWDGSLEAARAVQGAMPFLEKAKRIELICVEEHGALPEAANEDGVKSWLRAHGADPVFSRIAHHDSTLPEAIIAKTGAVHADLLVMGAYGHSHISEMLMGGVTDHILKNVAMPTLMAN